MNVSFHTEPLSYEDDHCNEQEILKNFVVIELKYFLTTESKTQTHTVLTPTHSRDEDLTSVACEEGLPCGRPLRENVKCHF